MMHLAPSWTFLANEISELCISKMAEATILKKNEKLLSVCSRLTHSQEIWHSEHLRCLDASANKIVHFFPFKTEAVATLKNQIYDLKNRLTDMAC